MSTMDATSPSAAEQLRIKLVSSGPKAADALSRYSAISTQRGPGREEGSRLGSVFAASPGGRLHTAQGDCGHKHSSGLRLAQIHPGRLRPGVPAAIWGD